MLLYDKIITKGIVSDRIGIHYIIYFVDMTANENTAG
jgi:hypothetical protein